MKPQNLVEKIAQRFAVGLDQGHAVQVGDYLSIRPSYCMTHDNTGAVLPKYKSIGASRIADPRQLVFALDHNVQDTSEENLKKYKKIEDFAREHDIDFYPAGRGIGHQIMCEEGYAWPGTLVVASDSHSNMYGGLGCLGTPIVRTDAAAIWSTGRTWWQVPPVAKVEFRGRLQPGVTGKDVIITLCGIFNDDEVLNYALEFTGEGVAGLTIEQRLTIANMSTEWGALVGIFPIDEVTYTWLNRRAEFIAARGLSGVPSDEDGDGEHPRINAARIAALRRDHITSDKGAFYSKEISLDLSAVQPFVSGPNTVKAMSPIGEIRRKNVKIHKAYLVSCVNSRLDDLSEAAAMIKGKKVADGVEFYVSAASSEVQAESEKRGDWQILVDAGAIPLPPGCGPCIGLGKGTLQDNEVGISATNRNFKGRMGSSSAQAYLSSPAIVAASAVAGKIDLPGSFSSRVPKGQIRAARRSPGAARDIPIIPGFPEKIEGELVFCHQDNLNTDGIFPGKYTYIDDFTPAQQASVVMENYDPDFRKMVEEGDILVGGYNFGTGSSREQAATALKHRGISLVLAGSFSETYKRNALNNGYLVIEAPQLVDELKTRLGIKSLTVRTGFEAKIDFRHSMIYADDKKYPIGPVGAAAQELIVAGGLENWVKERLKK